MLLEFIKIYLCTLIFFQIPVEKSDNSSYHLYLYGEGAYFQHVKRGNLQGIPVLFLPGHGGSYKQVRSCPMAYVVDDELHAGFLYQKLEQKVLKTMRS